MNENLLYTNRFYSTKVKEALNDEEIKKRQHGFRQYFENKLRLENLTQLPSQRIDSRLPIQDLLNTNRIDFEVKNDPASLLKLRNVDDKDDVTRYQKTRRTLVNIDSRNRNILLYPKQNSYKIQLNKTFRNIKRIALRSTEFPNSEQLVRDNPVNRTNNKIRWQNIGDSTTYVASITPGNYTPSTLQTEIQTQMNSIKNEDTDEFHEFTISIDAVTDLTTISSVQSNQFSNPFSTTADSGVITVEHNGHTFSEGDLVVISGAIGFDGLTADLINKTQTITSILGSTGYTFDLPSGTVATASISGGGGSNVKLGQELQFRLFFSDDDSIGTLLGFEATDTGYSSSHQNTTVESTFTIQSPGSLFINVGSNPLFTAIYLTEDHGLATGDKVYITGHSGTNADPSINDVAGQNISLLNATDLAYLQSNLSASVTALNTFKIPITTDGTSGSGGTVQVRNLNKPLKLSGENYILMTSSSLSNMVNTGDVGDVFAKIMLSAPPGNVLFNTFQSNPKVYEESPLNFLFEIDFQFKTQDGELFQFNDEDHSFTLEIVEYLDTLEHSGFSSQRGIRDRT